MDNLWRLAFSFFVNPGLIKSLNMNLGLDIQFVVLVQASVAADRLPDGGRATVVSSDLISVVVLCPPSVWILFPVSRGGTRARTAHRHSTGAPAWPSSQSWSV